MVILFFMVIQSIHLCNLRDDPRLTKPVVQTASPLDRSIDEIVKAYFPDLQDDQDTKNMVRGLFDADNNDKAMVINSLMEMGFKPGGRRVSEVESDNDDPLNARSIYQVLFLVI